MGRQKKKPEYDSEKIMEQFTNCIAEAYMSGAGGGSANSLRQISEQFGITLFSRDEKKQDDMRHEFQIRMPEVADKIKFYIGDVRNLQSCKNAMHGVDYIFHAAALKQVPSCEFFPMEAVQTNVIGTDNVLTAAIEAGVERLYYKSCCCNGLRCPFGRWRTFMYSVCYER